jgi:hypothetical protein
MGVPTSEVGYTSATTGRGDHEVYKGHVVALGRGDILNLYEVGFLLPESRLSLLCSQFGEVNCIISTVNVKPYGIPYGLTI